MHTPTALSTITLEDGSMQSIFEVYSDESREQTLGFVYDEHLATALWSHDTLVEALKETQRYLDELAHMQPNKDRGSEFGRIREVIQDALAKNM